MIRTRVHVDVGAPARATGQLRYVTDVDGRLVSGRYPYVADLAESFEVTELEFLEPAHPVYALRSAEPLSVTFGLCSPSITFYPGDEGSLGSLNGS